MLQQIVCGIRGMLMRLTGECQRKNETTGSATHYRTIGKRGLSRTIFILASLMIVIADDSIAARCDGVRVTPPADSSIARLGRALLTESVPLLVTCEFLGTPYGLWGLDSHAGIDYRILTDPVPVYSVTQGVVVTAGGTSGQVSVKMADGSLFSYLHLSEISVSKGPIAVGTLIGKTGAVGADGVHHLHVEWIGSTYANNNPLATGRSLCPENGKICTVEMMSQKLIDPTSILRPFTVNGIADPQQGDVEIVGHGFGPLPGRVQVDTPIWCSTCLAAQLLSDHRYVIQVAPENWRDDKITVNVKDGKSGGNTVLSESGVKWPFWDFDTPKTITVMDANNAVIGAVKYPFDDVDPKNGLTCYVQNLWRNGAIRGKAQGKFDPEGPVTRAEFVKMAMKAKNPGATYPYSGGPVYSAYVDVPPPSEWISYLNSAKSSGYLDLLTTSCISVGTFGLTAGQFRLTAPLNPAPSEGNRCFFPDRPITRVEAASILAGVFELQIQGDINLQTGRWLFDVAPISTTPAANYIYRVATNAGNAGCPGPEYIVHGYNDLTFGVHDSLTRSQAAKMIAVAKKPVALPH